MIGIIGYRSNDYRWLLSGVATGYAFAWIGHFGFEGNKPATFGYPLYSFVSDHIETLYEIDILYKALAEEHGINLKRCESLNTNKTFIAAMKELVLSKIY